MLGVSFAARGGNQPLVIQLTVHVSSLLGTPSHTATQRLHELAGLLPSIFPSPATIPFLIDQVHNESGFEVGESSAQSKPIDLPLYSKNRDPYDTTEKLYSKRQNASRLYTLKKQVCDCKQGTSDVTFYFNKLSTLARDGPRPLPSLMEVCYEVCLEEDRTNAMSVLTSSATDSASFSARSSTHDRGNKHSSNDKQNSGRAYVSESAGTFSTIWLYYKPEKSTLHSRSHCSVKYDSIP
ncbi:uncharacterized protein E5676_scaffold359G00510 [Cucumis melo var. makuwa]|uniref:Uncharacterized protein n=1 Tax=Cucumis melo var. makuwa TaxID=1194695 RepID=A0A5D3DC67_CUCMM|nr:uncharacterized protein E5676_scaffold359G00510 [Cucumis melo var. makuwa]